MRGSATRSARGRRTARRAARACPTAPATSTPAGGGTCLPMVLNSWPMKPSGVQLARPIGRPAGTRAAARPPPSPGRRVNITPKVESTTSKLPSANGSASASASRKSIVEALGLGALPAALEQRGDVVGRGDVAPAPRRGERGIAVAGGDVEHALAGAQVDRLAQALADDLQRRADDGVVAGGPGGLLARLERCEVGRGAAAFDCGMAALGHGFLLVLIGTADRLGSARAQRCRPADCPVAQHAADDGA